jgi:hypothetical protein
MRNSVISSSVATIVAQVNDCLVAAGVAVRTLLLCHTSMRDERRGWHEPHLGLGSLASGFGRFHAAKHPWAGLKRSQQCAFAYCPAYAATARFAPKG